MHCNCTTSPIDLQTVRMIVICAGEYGFRWKLISTDKAPFCLFAVRRISTAGLKSSKRGSGGWTRCGGTSAAWLLSFLTEIELHDRDSPIWRGEAAEEINELLFYHLAADRIAIATEGAWCPPP